MSAAAAVGERGQWAGLGGGSGDFCRGRGLQLMHRMERRVGWQGRRTDWMDQASSSSRFSSSASSWSSSSCSSWRAGLDSSTTTTGLRRAGWWWWRRRWQHRPLVKQGLDEAWMRKLIDRGSLRNSRLVLWPRRAGSRCSGWQRKGLSQSPSNGSMAQRLGWRTVHLHLSPRSLIFSRKIQKKTHFIATWLASPVCCCDGRTPHHNYWS